MGTGDFFPSYSGVLRQRYGKARRVGPPLSPEEALEFRLRLFACARLAWPMLSVEEPS